MKLRMPNPPDSIHIHAVQRGTRKPLKWKRLKMGVFAPSPKSALGAGGRAFKSPRPDQLKTSALFAMSGFGRTSAPVAICGVLGLLEALDSYKFDFHEDAPVVKRFVARRIHELASP